ncbi:MAG: hypothetical protein QOG03_699, partial [Actinomycetota bacterium]|nr:hypothetical protein [Actinomycetota bacterium]
LILSTALFVMVLALSPLIAAYYHRSNLVPIVAVLALTVYTNAFLGLPSALYMRGLDYLKQNIISALGPVVGFVVTIPLAYAGYGIWALVDGSVAALVVSAVAVAWATPMRPRVKMDGPVARRFVAYGWPLWVSRLLGLSTTVAGTLVISKSLGLAALGFFSVAQGLAARAFRLDAMVAQTLFPALCRVPDDVEGQRRAFVATNRVTAMWSGPIGFGLAIFAGDLAHLILGPKWAPAVFLLRMQGIAIVLGSIGFSWDIFFRARGRTKPTLAWSIVNELWVFLVLLPAVVLFGLNGAAWAIGSLGIIAIVTRQIPIHRLFPGMNLLRDTWREVAAGSVAAAAAYGLRHAVGAPRTIVGFLALVGADVVLSVIAVVAVDRRFILDLIRKVRRPGPGVSPPVPDEAASLATAAPSVTAGADEAAGWPVGVLPRRQVVEDQIAVPGVFPFWLTAAGGERLWLTIRDSSTLAWHDLTTGEWRTWRLPLWPHIVGCDDRGRAWVALTLASKVAVVDPESGATSRVRLPRTRELLGATWDQGAAWVVDSWHRRLWRVDDGTLARDLPDGMLRPDTVVADGRGCLWVTDIGRPVLARVGGSSGDRVFPTAGRVRTAVVSPDGLHLWLGHFVQPLVSRLSLDDPDRGTVTLELPGTPFGLAFGPDGLLWAALFDLDAVVGIDETGVKRRVDLPAGSGPTSLVAVGDRLVVSCASSSILAVVR